MDLSALNGDFTVLYDCSLEGMNNLSCGANVCEYHYTGLDMQRDVRKQNIMILQRYRKAVSARTVENLAVTVSRGIEVGNIFQLGTKYTKSMNMTYIDSNGEKQYPIMDAMVLASADWPASICEAHHDDYGPIWPLSVAPWQIHICAVRADDTVVREYADRLYEELQRRGAEVIYDDRNVSAGVMFSDADLLGVPFRQL